MELTCRGFLKKLSFTVPDELLEATARDAGVGVPPMPTDISNRAWLAIRDFSLMPAMAHQRTELAGTKR
jgi:hypothetical protein